LSPSHQANYSLASTQAILSTSELLAKVYSYLWVISIYLLQAYLTNHIYTTNRHPILQAKTIKARNEAGGSGSGGSGSRNRGKGKEKEPEENAKNGSGDEDGDGDEEEDGDRDSDRDADGDKTMGKSM
jgi:hypothetical protein